MIPVLSPIWPAATRELCNHLWQSTLFVLVVSLLALALRNYPARARYWLWMAASGKFVIPFFLLIAAGSHFARLTHASPVPTQSYLAIDAMSQPFTQTSVVDGASGPDRRVASQPASPHQRFTWPAALVATWFLGLAAVFTFRVIQWRRVTNFRRQAVPLQEGRVVEILRHIEQLARITRPIAVLSSQGLMEPGVVGVLRPVLLWPEAILPHLDDAHLQAVLAHEAAHVRRHDNLTSLFHMLVEAIFWFHPLVWWIESQLVKERERSCDDEVLLLFHQPQAYAESILKVCELCVESPITCVSGITGADLKRRIVQIMTASITRKLGVGARLFLLAAGLVAVSAPVILGQMKGARVVAAVKASAHAEARALNFAARVWPPLEPESFTPSNTSIALSPVPKFEMKEPIKLAQMDTDFAQNSKQPLTNTDVDPKDLTGQWQGTAQGPQLKLRVVFLVSKADGGGWKTVFNYIDLIAQGIGIPRDARLTVGGSAVQIDVPGNGGSYHGQLSADGNSITGSWAHGGPNMTLNLVRATAETAWEFRSRLHLRRQWRPTPIRPSRWRPSKPAPTTPLVGLWD